MSESIVRTIVVALSAETIVTFLAASSQETSAPRASATNLAGSIVLSFLMMGATSFVLASPQTLAFLLLITRTISSLPPVTALGSFVGSGDVVGSGEVVGLPPMMEVGPSPPLLLFFVIL